MLSFMKKGRSMPIICSIFYLLSCLLIVTTTSHADKVRLKNGNTIDGIIEQETDNAITVNLGYGTMTLKKSSIISLHRGFYDF